MIRNQFACSPWKPVSSLQQVCVCLCSTEPDLRLFEWGDMGSVILTPLKSGLLLFTIEHYSSNVIFKERKKTTLLLYYLSPRSQAS